MLLKREILTMVTYDIQRMNLVGSTINFVINLVKWELKLEHCAPTLCTVCASEMWFVTLRWDFGKEINEQKEARIGKEYIEEQELKSSFKTENILVQISL